MLHSGKVLLGMLSVIGAIPAPALGPATRPVSKTRAVHHETPRLSAIAGMWRRGSLAAVARAAKSMPSVDADFCGWHARGGHFRKADALGAFIFRFYRNRAGYSQCKKP
tara:strand:+ start:289 stop:615 length:327 start_codon:yes stop_codon:yes gene_type:complete